MVEIYRIEKGAETWKYKAYDYVRTDAFCVGQSIPIELEFSHDEKEEDLQAVILIEDDRLAEALNALPQNNRDIFLMYWFLDMADREIAERMNMARRTVNARRQKAYRLLKELMGGDVDG